ncbi:MAG: alpha/beta hydrolase [Alphaproteobacteria bacterium]|nr:alpha/beta hydrolase [Alphaproteobacteria bacterium]
MKSKYQTASPIGLAVFSCVCLLALVLNGCATPLPFESRYSHAEGLAKSGGWSPFVANDAARFSLQGFRAPARQNGTFLRIYIEGDGYSWTSPSTPSSDPSPRNPVALRMALADPLATHYLARPCQFAGRHSSGCETRHWTYARFSPELVQAVDSAIDEIAFGKEHNGIQLVGYSGGGVMAALIAARRQDIALLATVAAPLDIDLWTAINKIGPLRESLSPVDFTSFLLCVPQLHLAGEDDDVVPPRVVESYLAKLQTSVEERQSKAKSCQWKGKYAPSFKLVTVQGIDHDGAWDLEWRRWSQRLNDHFGLR